MKIVQLKNNYLLIISLILSILFTVSCSDDDTGTDPDPNEGDPKFGLTVTFANPMISTDDVVVSSSSSKIYPYRYPLVIGRSNTADSNAYYYRYKSGDGEWTSEQKYNFDANNNYIEARSGTNDIPTLTQEYGKTYTIEVKVSNTNGGSTNGGSVSTKNHSIVFQSFPEPITNITVTPGDGQLGISWENTPNAQGSTVGGHIVAVTLPVNSQNPIELIYPEVVTNYYPIIVPTQSVTVYGLSNGTNYLVSVIPVSLEGLTLQGVLAGVYKYIPDSAENRIADNTVAQTVFGILSAYVTPKSGIPAASGSIAESKKEE